MILMGQAPLRSYDSAPRPPPFSLPDQQVVFFSQSPCVSQVELTDGEGGEGGDGEEPNHTMARSQVLYQYFRVRMNPLFVSLSVCRRSSLLRKRGGGRGA